METVGISELKARFSEYLKKAKAGNEVLITERGKVVARLSPFSRAKTVRESIGQMEKQGLIKLGPRRLPTDFWTLKRPTDPERLVLGALVEERKTGR